jgi:arginine/lysine/histidine transporter system substrate-binding protein
MRRRQLILISAIAFLTLIGAIAGCNDRSSTNNNPTGEFGDAANKEVLTMVTSPDYPPYEFYDTSGGEQKIVGFDIDIANYIAKRLAFELKIQESDFNGLIPALQANRADFVMAGMTPTKERKKSVDFSIIYYQTQDTIVSLKGSKLTKPEDLANKKVGVQLGSIQEDNAKKIAQTVSSVQVQSLNKVPELIQEIKSKRIDAAIIENTVAEGFVSANPDLEFYIIPSEGETGSAIAFPKNSPHVEAFNRILTEMKKNGELDRLAQKWFSKNILAEPAATPSPSSDG